MNLVTVQNLLGWTMNLARIWIPIRSSPDQASPHLNTPGPGGMEGDEDPATRDALAVLQDVVQLCAVMRGETDSCSFTSMCSDCFTGIAMQHLCSPTSGDSAPSRLLLPVLGQLGGGGGGGGGGSSSSSGSEARAGQDGQDGIAAAAAAATEAAKLSMALAEERSAGMAELQARLDAKDAEAKALLADNAILTRELEDKDKQHASPKAGSLAPQHGVQVIPSSELDLDVSNKSKLGQGVYSEVYLTTRQVALKALRGRFNQQRFREFKHEAEMLQLVQGSTGVCRLHGICIDSLPNLYLVTEPIFGSSLEAHLQSTRGIGLDLAVPMARNIASAMSDVHAKGMAHRDLKPSNCILAKYDNRVIKLVDFGLARLLEGDLIPPEDHDGAGTPMYQAPEVLQRKGVGLASDVFSFAIVMWEMISGEIPYEGLSLNEMKMAVLAGARPSVKPGWNKEWVDLMRSCWAPEPTKRPPFAVVEQILSQMMPTQQVSKEVAPPPDAETVRLHITRLRVWALVCCLCVPLLPSLRQVRSFGVAQACVGTCDSVSDPHRACIGATNGAAGHCCGGPCRGAYQ